jgi:hypothetical protein
VVLVRAPRRAAVVLSAVALTGALAACNGNDTTTDDPAGTDPGVTDPLAPGGGVEGEETEPTP